MYKKIITFILCTFLFIPFLYAKSFFTENDFRQHLNKEIRVTVLVNPNMERTRTILLYLVDIIDSRFLLGATNAGRIHIPIDAIIYVTEQKRGVQGVLNHH